MSRVRSATSVDDVADRLAHASVRLARLLRQQGEGDLTPTTRATLGTISREGPISLGDLATIERVAPPTITKIVGKLEDAGLVDRVVGAEDRRVVRVSLSPAGRQWLDVEWRRRRDWLTEQLEGLTAADVDRLAAAVEVIERLTAAEAP